MRRIPSAGHPRGAHAAGHRVGYVTQFIDRFQYPFLRRITHASALICNDARDSTFGDTGSIGYIDDRRT